MKPFSAFRQLFNMVTLALVVSGAVAYKQGVPVDMIVNQPLQVLSEMYLGR
jgi:hypothetical protein